MAFLYQDPVSIANTDKLTISTWFNWATLPPPFDFELYNRSLLLQWFIPDHSVINWVYGHNMSTPAESSLIVALCGNTGGAHPNFVQAGVLWPFSVDVWDHLFLSFSGNSLLINIYRNGVDILTPQLPGALTGLDDPLADYTIAINGGQFGHPILPVNAITGHPQVRFFNTQVWFGTYVAPIAGNLDKFVAFDGSGNPIPPPDIRAAQDAFGPSDIWFNRDSVSDIKYEENQGTAGLFTLVGTPPPDFQPGPEEP